jgi:hypothetical protein
MPEDPKEPMSSAELIRRAREDLDSDAGDNFELPSYTAERREADAARAQRDAEQTQAEADTRIVDAEPQAEEQISDAWEPEPAATSPAEPDEVAAGYGSLEPDQTEDDVYGPVVTPQAEGPAPEPAAKRSFKIGWLRWLIAGGFVAFALFRFLDPSTAVDNLSVGDCFDDPGGNEIASVNLIDCAEPHDYEIYALVELAGDAGTFPGDEALFSELADVCFNRFAVYVGHDYASSVYDFSGLTPLADSWEQGDHEGVCLVHRFDESGVVKKNSSAADAGI